MKTILALIFCLLALPAGLAGFAFAQTTNAGIETDIAASSDAAIEARLSGIFDQIEGLENIDATVRSGVVTLRGKVQEARFAARAAELSERVNGVVAVNNEIAEETSVGERLVPVFERLEARALQALSYVPLILVALLCWAVVAFFGAFLAHRRWPFRQVAPNTFIADLLRQVVRIAFMIIGGVLALDILGATALLGTLLGAAGIVGLAVGFAVRDTVENYIASILLSVRQPFRPQDFVRIDNYEGFVISLTARATILMEVDGNHIRIPNATVFKSVIINYTVNPQRRFTFEVGVDANSDLDRALKIGLETVSRQDFILDEPAADAWIRELGDSNVVLVFVGWVNQAATDLLKARSEAMRLVKRALETNGFSLPEPTYRLRLDDDIQSALSFPAASLSTGEERKAAAVSSEPETAQDTAIDSDLQRRIAEERHQQGRGDLLDENAPNEFGKS
ncbi:mechanosensitive ion channel [Martelella lutilitoris]|uniref:Small-conductance mechanosensitive channel n=1 Tax=Martelella lutilitoris TaxID=2583532 RepID=A0A5C4JV31_9HYPH|nr:mechanosensitive ion channel family protein [Martelella lutilitoris]TNB49235.1 mechanosensitive ion channel [Martelella lutilitoris]